MTKLTITPTTEAHTGGLQAVLFETGLFPPDMLPELLAPSLAGRDTHLWLSCHLGSELAGFCHATPEAMTDGCWNMRALAVRPVYQRQGLGKALVQALEARLRAEGQRLLLVDTSGSDGFAKARAFYAKSGYSAVARIRDFWAEGDDKITFRKSLARP